MTATGAHEREAEIVAAVLDAMGDVVRPDGGEVVLRSFDPAARLVVVDYRQGGDAECGDCAIDPATLRQFIVESLRSHGIPTDNVHVEPVTGGNPVSRPH